MKMTQEEFVLEFQNKYPDTFTTAALQQMFQHYLSCGANVKFDVDLAK